MLNEQRDPDQRLPPKPVVLWRQKMLAVVLWFGAGWLVVMTALAVWKGE